jgi:hypothetical protein
MMNMTNTMMPNLINDDAKRNHKEIARFSNDGITRLNMT